MILLDDNLLYYLSYGVMPRLKRWNIYEFQLSQDTVQKILRFPIWIELKKQDRDKRETAVRENSCKYEPNPELYRDIAESFDCWWMSIEHLTAIRNFLSQWEEYTRVLPPTP
jgi:hypothetical protein